MYQKDLAKSSIADGKQPTGQFLTLKNHLTKNRFQNLPCLATSTSSASNNMDTPSFSQTPGAMNTDSMPKENSLQKQNNTSISLSTKTNLFHGKLYGCDYLEAHSSSKMLSKTKLIS